MAKTVLITGAAVRIGREIALSLAASGFDVVIHYHRSKKQALALAAAIEKKGRKAYTVQADLQKPETVKSLFNTLAKAKVRVDCLINNAAAFEKDTLATLTPEGWRHHIAVNLLSPLLLIQQFAAQYKGREGNVINITDGIAGWSVSAGFLSYSLSKMGLENAASLLASELAPYIRINTIAPGPTLEGTQDKKDTFDKLKKLIPLARTTSPKEICDTVCYILATPSLTGQVISLSGGLK